jgi:hypothetical protein
MSKNFVRAAVAMVALMVATVVLEGQANAGGCFKGLFGRHKGGCCAAEEASCGAPAEASCGCPAVEESCGAPAEVSCAAPEPTCGAPEPSCGCPVVEESCGCPAEEASCGCSSGRKFKLFGRFRKKHSCCESSCEPACGAPVESSCGCPAVEEPACGAPAEAAPADAETPPAPEAPAAT